MLKIISIYIYNCLVMLNIIRIFVKHFYNPNLGIFKKSKLNK
jgi:hypothetical protein